MKVLQTDLIRENNGRKYFFFNPGQIVTLKQDIPNKPIMLVVKKETSIFKHKEDDKKNILRGIRCRWFTTTGELQEEIFNTKDLILIK